MNEGGARARGEVYRKVVRQMRMSMSGEGLLVAMYVHKGVFQRLRVYCRGHVYVDRGFGFNRRLGNGGVNGKRRNVSLAYMSIVYCQNYMSKLELTEATKILL